MDGDIYFVSWDPLLIPPSQDEPMDYHPAKPVILDHDVTIEVDVSGYDSHLNLVILIYYFCIIYYKRSLSLYYYKFVFCPQ